jgi:hypothetical protein
MKYGWNLELESTIPGMATCPGDSGAGVFALQGGAPRLIAVLSGRSFDLPQNSEKSNLTTRDIKVEHVRTESNAIRLDHPQICKILAQEKFPNLPRLCKTLSF